MKTAILLLLTSALALNAQAGSATWKLNPANGDWNTAANWTPATVPNGPTDDAMFALSNTTSVSLRELTTVNNLVFNPGASAFTITVSTIFNIMGLVNDSGVTQNFVSAPGSLQSGGQLSFRGSASAASCSITNNPALPGGFANGQTTFDGTATAGDATITNRGGTLSGNFGGITLFLEASTAGSATITSEGGATDGAGDGSTIFVFGGNGGNATLICNGAGSVGADGGVTEFSAGSNAGNSTLVANPGSGSGSGTGGTIAFSSDSDGGTARVILSGSGNLNVTNHDFTPVTVGSVEGDGNISISSRELVVGSNNLSTTFSGRITDSGNGGTITKTGRGIWILTKANKYTGGTFINGGKLVANNRNGSATGTSPVQVNKGTLAGGGTIAGTVTVGSGRGRAAEVSPGRRGENNSGTLTILADLTFYSDGSYNFQVDSDVVVSDSVVAAGVVIQSGAQFNPSDLGSSVLPIGTSFVALDNTSATPIAGTFANLTDGSTVTVSNNTFQANYEGGDGNDLTLTIVP